MPKRLRRLVHSLAGRMALAVFGSVTLALLVGTAASLWLEVDRYAGAKRDALTATAEVFASAAARAAGEGDARAATETLRAIGRRPDLVYAAIERPDGSTLADQGLAVRLASDLDLGGPVSALDLLTSRTAQVRVPVIHHGTSIGTLVLVADTTDLSARLAAIVETSALGSALALALGLAVSYPLQRSITQPIAALAGTMDRVRIDEDYSRTAEVVRADEVGILAGTFNTLLAAVRERDERLARHRARLEEDVAERTADLRDAKEAAEAANAAKSSFLATMSHEIRTPLNGMLVLAELLAGAELPQRQKRHAEVIARSGQSLLAIINDILDFAKVEAGRIDLEHVAVAPDDVVDTVVSLFAEKAREKGLDLSAFVSPEVPGRILGDPVRLGQVLSNFVNNALKFTEGGSVMVRIVPTPGGLRLSVTDTGIGIAAEALPTIFSAFSQADQSTTRRYGGTGLGLSIAQRLIEAMNGTIGVDSEVGVGSTFWAEVPIAGGAEPRERAVLSAAMPGAFVLDLAGVATRGTLHDRLVAAGFTPVSPSAAAEAHWFGDATRIAAARARPPVSGRVVAVAAADDAAALLDAGWADEVLRWPLLQDDMNAMLAALAAGRLPTGSASRPATTASALPAFPLARVLVADDSAVNREVATEALGRFGITRIETAADGKAAVELCLSRTFDLVLMDASMPVLDGYAAARAIREGEEDQGRARVAIVSSTAHVIGTAADHWREAGMDATLAKPFTLRALSEVLSRLLAPGAADTAPIGPAPEDAPDREAANPLLDAATLDNLREMARTSEGTFAARVVAIFAEHGPTAAAQLREASAQADSEAVARAAHSLRSMSLNVGGQALATHLKAIERAARERGLCPDEAAAGGVDDLLGQTIDGLRRHFAVESAGRTDPISEHSPHEVRSVRSGTCL